MTEGPLNSWTGDFINDNDNIDDYQLQHRFNDVNPPRSVKFADLLSNRKKNVSSSKSNGKMLPDDNNHGRYGETLLDGV